MSTFGGVLSFGQVCQQNRKSKESWKQQNNLGKKTGILIDFCWYIFKLKLGKMKTFFWNSHYNSVD